MVKMTIRLNVDLECSADAAWQAVHNPAVAADLYAPFMVMKPTCNYKFPERFLSGTSVVVKLLVFGFLTVGKQKIVIEDIADRTMRDSGRPLSGPLALLKFWNHEITVSNTSASSNSHWRDELTIGGFFAPVFFLVLKPTWFLRGKKIKKLSKKWNAELSVQKNSDESFSKAESALPDRLDIVTPRKGELE